jgi:hypothetical protein
MGKEFNRDNGEVETIQLMRSDPEKVQRYHVLPAEISGIKTKKTTTR